jgi:RNA polymerase sigma-B factor
MKDFVFIHRLLSADGAIRRRPNPTQGGVAVSRDRRGSTGPTEDLRALILSYRQDPTPERQAELAARLLPLVGQVAQRYAGLGTTVDDLVQVGSIGLLNAIANFDLDRGVRFETYARHLIAGEIRHYLRDQGSVVRRPRWFHELDHRVRQAATLLTQRLGRLPLVPEIADELGIPVQWVMEAARTRESFRFLSLDEVREDGDGTPVTAYDRLSASQLSGQITHEDRVVLADAVDRLSEMQRKVIYCLFYLDLTQTEAAQHLGISQKHVSRMMHAAVRRLRDALQPNGGEGRRARRPLTVAAE